MSRDFPGFKLGQGWHPNPVKNKKKDLDTNTKNVNSVTMTKIVEMNQEMATFIQSLRKQGHKCVMEMESFPVQFAWCGQEKCNIQTDG